MSLASPFTAIAATILPPLDSSAQQQPVEALFSVYEQQVFKRTNQFFAWLLSLQWAFAVVFAIVWSPRSWAGRESFVYPHVLAAIFGGALLVGPPLLIIRWLPYHMLTRHVIAVAQICFSGLLIDLTGGRVETHFHVFGSLAFIALYRDWRVLPTATLVVALDHLLRGIWYPESVYGVPDAAIWRTAEHAGWVIFEDVVLVWACLVSRREMWEICQRQFQNEVLLSELEQRVHDRTRELESEVRGHQTTSQELRKSEERLRQLIHNVPIGIFESTRKGEILLANPHLLSMLALPTNQDLSKLDMTKGEIFPLEQRNRFWQKLEEVKDLRGFGVTMNKSDGQTIDVVINAHLKPATPGSGPTCEGTIEDVTETKVAAEKLATLHTQLVVASRQAGMADVATGVLHNVGNVLTSVNLIMHDVQDRLKSSRLSHLRQFVGLLQSEQHRLGEYLTVDPIGRDLPKFLVKLETHLATEAKKLGQDVETLMRHFEHIKEIIVMQQNSARLFGVSEILLPSQLIEDALRLNVESLGRHGVVHEKVFVQTPEVNADRHKVMQILVNLMKNAKDSLLSSKNDNRRVILRVAPVDEKTVALSVADNGVGIPPENLRKIFQHGFTTKKEGHGFGLHSCVLAAREMSGDLTVASDGPGKGAIFTLTLPVAKTATV